MKKFSRVGLAGLLVGTMITSGVASADTITCTFDGTGPNSNNTCLQYIGQSCTITNNNTITVTGSSTQQSGTGSASSSGNGTSGGATSGSSSNSNSSSTNLQIDNTGACVAVTPVTPTPTPTPTPQPEQGQVEAAQVTAPVGGVKAGAGGADHSGVLIALGGASVAAFGLGLRTLRRRLTQE